MPAAHVPMHTATIAQTNRMVIMVRLACTREQQNTILTACAVNITESEIDAPIEARAVGSAPSCWEDAMLERKTPPFRADHVGSLIRPAALIAARQAADRFGAERKEMPDAELKRIQEDAIRAVVRLQEDIGLKLVTDGEFNRGSWQRDFLLKLANVTLIPSKIKVRFHSQAGMRDHAPPSLQVTGKLARPHGIFVDD